MALYTYHFIYATRVWTGHQIVPCVVAVLLVRSLSAGFYNTKNRSRVCLPGLPSLVGLSRRQAFLRGRIVRRFAVPRFVVDVGP